MGKTQRRAAKRSQQAQARGVAEAPRAPRQKRQRSENYDAGRDFTPVLTGNRFEAVLSDDEPGLGATGDSEPRSAALKQKASQRLRRAAKKKRLAAGAAPAPEAQAQTIPPEAAPPAKPQAVDALLARQPSAQGAVLHLPGGVVCEVLRAAPADARVAMPGDAVKLTYQGRLAEARKGRTFDKGEVDFLLGDGGMSNGNMIRGFDVGVVGMAVSERRLLRIPWKMGYGKKGNKPKVPPFSDLIFDVVLNHAGLEWSNQAKSSMSNKRREATKRIGKKHKIN